MSRRNLLILALVITFSFAARAGFKDQWHRLKEKFLLSEMDHDPSRRSFMQKGAAAGLMVGSGGGIAKGVQALSQIWDKEILRRLARARIRNGYFDLHKGGMESYLDFLKMELRKGHPPELAKIIRARISEAERLLIEPDFLYDARPSLGELKSSSKWQERIARRLRSTREKEKQSSLKSGRALKSLLSFRDQMGMDLLKKMRYQILLTRPSQQEFVVVFSEAEIERVEVYLDQLLGLKAEIESFNNFGSLDWEKMLDVWIQEALWAQELYHASVEFFVHQDAKKKRALSCRALL